MSRLFQALPIAMVAFVQTASAATFYWDTNASVDGNSATTGANLGGSGSWSVSDANWWSTGTGLLQAWTSGNDAVFWGTAGQVTVATVSPRALVFKTTGYSINSGRLTMTGTLSSFTVDAGVTATIGSEIAGPNSLVKLGLGTLILANPANVNGANATMGGWRIEGGGTLHIVADGSLGAPLPDSARNTVTDIQLNQSTIQFGASFDLSINRRTKVNTNASTNRGDAIIDTHGNTVRWFGSIQGGPGSLRVINSGPVPGILILGTDKIANINPFGSSLPAGAVNLTVSDGAIVQTAGTVTPTNGELGSETGEGGTPLSIKLDNGQIRSESGGYSFQRHLILGPGGGSLDVGAWDQTFTGNVSGPGQLSKEGTGTLTINNLLATWNGGTQIRAGTLQLGRGGSNGYLPGNPGGPSSVTISAGATLKFVRGSNKSFFDNISGAGGVTVANSPDIKVRLVSNNSYTGPTTIASGVLMIGQGNPGEPGTLASPLINNNGALVFNRVENLTYTGAISGQGTLEKQAAGRLTLGGTHNYTGATTVTAGSLMVNGVLGDSVVTVTGGLLGGVGTINGPVTIQSTGRLAPGVTVGVLTINNALTIVGETIMELNWPSGSDQVRGLTSVTYGGKLTLSVQGTLGATNTFKLFSAQSYSGSFSSVSPATPGAGLDWDTSTLSSDGTLRVVGNAPMMITNSVSGNMVTLSWPNQSGWRLQAQTNAAGAGLGSAWQDVPDSDVTNPFSFSIDRIVGSVFYRLNFRP